MAQLDYWQAIEDGAELVEVPKKKKKKKKKKDKKQIVEPQTEVEADASTVEKPDAATED